MPKKAKTPPAAKPAKSKPGKIRQLKQPLYASFKLQGRIKPTAPKVANSFRLFKKALLTLRKQWKVFLGIILLYGFLNVLFVQSFAGASDLGNTKAIMDEVFQGGEQLVTGASLFVYLISSSGNTESELAGAYQMMLTVVVSLVLIWTLREVYANNKVRVRDGFYRGMYPLVPFLMVLGVILLQLIPFALGLFLYNIVTTGGIAVLFIEQLLWNVFLFLMALLSLYMVTSSIFALYIVCLPDMTPLKALRSARQLVRYRRWMVMRKIVFLPIMLLILSAVIVIPLILFATPVAPWVFFVLSMCILPILHSYMYGLYRELL